MSWFQIGAAKAACATTTWAKSSGSALRICRLSVMPVSPAMTRKMISFVSRNCSKFSARLYGSRCPKTKQSLADLRGEESKEEELVTKSMPIPEGRVGALIASMQETQFKGMLLYAD